MTNGTPIQSFGLKVPQEHMRKTARAYEVCQGDDDWLLFCLVKFMEHIDAECLYISQLLSIHRETQLSDWHEACLTTKSVHTQGTQMDYWMVSFWVCECCRLVTIWSWACLASGCSDEWAALCAFIIGPSLESFLPSNRPHGSHSGRSDQQSTVRFPLAMLC